MTLLSGTVISNCSDPDCPLPKPLAIKAEEPPASAWNEVMELLGFARVDALVKNN